jgi:hypothetical protein
MNIIFIANMLSCVPLVRSLICSYWLTEVLLETGTVACPLRAPGFTVYLFIYFYFIIIIILFVSLPFSVLFGFFLL